MSTQPEAMEHGPLREIFPDVFFVTGTMKGPIMGADWHFSRNMTVIRDGEELTLVNTVRLDDEGLAALDNLGKVTHVVRIGALHGMDDAFYVQRYGATYWAPPGIENVHGLDADETLVDGGAAPFAGGTVFGFAHSNMPEFILRLDREGGILIACDALQNWRERDEFFSDECCERMEGMGFFQSANIGPVWMQVNEPDGADFERLQTLEYRHALCGHGEPLVDTAKEDYAATFERVFAG